MKVERYQEGGRIRKGGLDSLGLILGKLERTLLLLQAMFALATGDHDLLREACGSSLIQRDILSVGGCDVCRVEGCPGTGLFSARTKGSC